MNSRAANMFRFSIALFDLFTLNALNFCLLLILDEQLQSKHYLLLLLFNNIAWIACSYFATLYVGKETGYEHFFKKSFQAFILFITFNLFFIFFSKFDYSRLYILFSFGAFGVLLAISRTTLYGANYFLATKSSVKRKVVVIGYNELSKNLVRNLSSGYSNSIVVNGYFDDSDTKYNNTGFAYLGTIKESIAYAIDNKVAEIYSVISPEMNNNIYDIAQQAEQNFIRFKFVPDFKMFINRKIHVDFSNEIPILSLRSEPLEHFESRVKKRMFDVVFSSFVILFILSWLVPLIAIIIKLNSKGPVFFKQVRSGKNNRPFVCFKFRSLHINTEADKKQVIYMDRRITAVGKFLRKTNLDEMPQFFNVFRGDMSVVGPRPHMLKHTEEYSQLLQQYMVRHFVKPGVTGWAQINGYRGEIREEKQLRKRIEHDIWYMENWNTSLDLRIVLLTMYHTIKGDENAY
jgi:putative colanic acid biosynthesis UDP-glucose lipid carrier transferase